MIGAGTVLAERFEIMGELGRGGTATVFLAHDRVLDTKVALKVLHGHLSGDLLMRDRLSREVQACRRLSHPNILPVFELHESDGHLYLAMAYHSGMTLGEHLSEKGPMGVDDVIQVGLQISEALEVAHLGGVLHRDIKPHNLLLDESLNVQLTDFGFARLVDLATMTASTHVLGTPGYVGPEIYAGARWEPRSDVYSVGAVMFEALTGRAPFQSTNPMAVITKQSKGPPPSIRTLRPDVPEWLDTLILSMLRPLPEGRPGGAAAIHQCLENRRATIEMELPSKQGAVEQLNSPGIDAILATVGAKEGTQQTEQAPPAPASLSEAVETPLYDEGKQEPPERDGPKAAKAIPDYPHTPTQRELQLYLWLRRSMDRVRHVYRENHSRLPPALQKLEAQLEDHEFDRMSMQLSQMYGTVERQGKVLREDGVDALRLQLSDMRHTLEEPTSTWLYSVQVGGGASGRGRRRGRKRGKKRRSRSKNGILSEEQLLAVVECLKAEGLWSSEVEDDLWQAAERRQPFNLVDGLPVQSAKRLQRRLQGRSISAKVHSPKLKGLNLRFDALIYPVIITAMLGMIGLPIFILAAVFFGVYMSRLAKPRNKQGVIDASHSRLPSGVEESVDEAAMAAEHYRHDGMVRRVLNEFELQFGISLLDNAIAMARVGEAVDRARVELRIRDEFHLYLPYLARSEDGPVDFEMTLVAADLERYPQPDVGESYGERLERHRHRSHRKQLGSDPERTQEDAPRRDKSPESSRRGASEPQRNLAENASAQGQRPQPKSDVQVAPEQAQVDVHGEPAAAVADPGPVSAQQSKVRPLAIRNIEKVIRLRERLDAVDALPDAAIVDLRQRVLEIEKVTIGLSEVGIKLEQALFDVDEIQVIRGLSALEQRQRRREGQGNEPDRVLEASIVEQRALLERMGAIDEDLARHMARLMALSAGLDSVGLLLTQADVADDLDDVAQVTQVVSRLSLDVDAASRLLEDDIEGSVEVPSPPRSASEVAKEKAEKEVQRAVEARLHQPGVGQG